VGRGTSPSARLHNVERGIAGVRVSLFVHTGRFRRPSWQRLVGSMLCGVLLALLTYDAHRDLPRDDGTLARIQKTGVWRIGMDISDPPFASEPDGVPIGLDVDFANALGERLGVHVQIQPLGYDGLYDALKTGTVDGLISALSIDPGRYSDVIYSAPYFDNGIVIAARDNGLIRMADLDGRRVAVEYGSTADETARLWQRRLHQLNEQLSQTGDGALDAARTGQADAALTDAVTARLYLKTHSGLTISPVSVTSDPYAVAVRNNSFFLAGAVNAALDAMRADGTLDALVVHWLPIGG
jgi:ABC-type amino acid transport substrate-binding protein